MTELKSEAKVWLDIEVLDLLSAAARELLPIPQKGYIYCEPERLTAIALVCIAQSLYRLAESAQRDAEASQ